MKTRIFLTCALLVFISLSSKIVAQSLAIPTLAAPANGSGSNPPNALLDWTASSGQTAYEFRIGLSNNLNSAPIVSVTTSQATLSNLLFGTLYYWQVRAVKTTAPIDSSNWSGVWSFATIDGINLVSPANVATNLPPDALLDWSALGGLSNYDYQLDTSSQFNSPLMSLLSISSATSQVTTSNLRFGTTYYWRIRGRHAADTTLWSEVRSFTTTDQLTLVSPANAATNLPPDALLDWSPLSGLSNYDYQLDTNAQFNSPMMSLLSISSATSQVTTSNLRFGTTYYWRIRGRHATDTTLWSEVRSFTTTDQLTLVSPANAATNLPPDALLDWSPLSGLSNYDYQLDTNAQFNSPMMSLLSISSATSQVTTSNLRFGTTYYWRIRGRHAVDTSLWSEVRSFTTTDQLTLVSPANAATNLPPDALLDWSPLSGLSNYDYQLDTNAQFNSALMSLLSISSATSQVTTSNLRFGTTYFWRIRGRHASDTSLWSEVRSFITTDEITLVSPANGATNVSTNPILDWSVLTGITNYQFQVDTLYNFSTATIQTISSASSQANAPGLLNSRIYYWRVRAWHASDTTSWSVIRSFGVGIASLFVPSFTQAGPFCSGDNIPALPQTSLNGINGTWSPAINNQATTTYIFTPAPLQSATVTSLTIEVRQPTAAIDVKTACNSFQWIDGIEYTQSTTTPTFVLSNAAGCDSVVTLNLTISFVDILSQPENTSVVVGNEATFMVQSDNAISTYQWQINTGSGFEDIAEGGQFSGTTTSTLTISSATLSNNNHEFRCIVSLNGCSIISELAVLTVGTTVSIQQTCVANNLVIYPNPGFDVIQIQSSEAQLGSSFQLVDGLGKVVLQGRLTALSQSIDISYISPGIYLFVINSDFENTFKLIKQ
jgi:hypothetical protein